ncbi:mucin-4-like [Phyllopteryx taeniolatus]|uniref:mucin-4-like n=1 Tax=Phyllopteryx taeniolatus TaxID=161469 RepID=UPI002AD454C6|nr:mucin-4-like [Phyllopteryx taeniolatus]
MDTKDGNSPYIKPPIGFPFLGKLYDRIYFSDNGLVQFQSVAENEQYLLPATLATGFPTDMNVSLLAVFWDDADLTLGDGCLFYKEYHESDMSDMYSHDVFNRTAIGVSKFEGQKGKPAFTPSWILKITWDHVMAVSYQKINLSETNTFQCILTTDGVQSFAILQYGEMRWGPGQREHHDALIGYMEGKSIHKEPTTPPENIFGTGGRYRPQQVKGPLGKLGQFVYDLSGPHGLEADSGLMCHAWAMKEPDPASWTDGLPSCHCTRNQALEDLSFLQDTTEQASHLKILRGQRWGGAGGHTFRSVLANKYGSGKRCVYDPEGPLLAGYSERYFSRQSIQKHIAMVYGSLHFITFDGTKYSFKALGEFVIMRLSSNTGSNIFTLQGQTEKLHTHTKGSINFPVVVRMAAFHQGIGKIEWRCAEKGEGLRLFIDNAEMFVTVGNSYTHMMHR